MNTVVIVFFIAGWLSLTIAAGAVIEIAESKLKNGFEKILKRHFLHSIAGNFKHKAQSKPLAVKNSMDLF